MSKQDVEERAIDSDPPQAADETTEVEPAEPTEAGTTGEGTPPEDAERRGELRGLLELGLLLLAVVVLAWGVVSWVQATGHDDAEVARAELRDKVLITARSHVETLNTLDARDLDAGLAKWESVATGTFKDQLAATTKETRELLASQGKVSTAKVVDAGVIDLKDDTATVIAVVEVSVAEADDPAAEPTVKRSRYTVDLAKVGGKWLVESLVFVGVDVS